MVSQIPHEIEGQDFLLQLINRKLLKKLKKFLKDPQITANVNLPSPKVRKNLWINSKSLVYIVIIDEQVCGWVGIRNIRKNEKSCTIDIAIRSDLWGKGLGSEILLLLEYVLKKVLEIGKIIANVYEKNHRAVKFFEKNYYTKLGSKSSPTKIVTFEKHLQMD